MSVALNPAADMVAGKAATATGDPLRGPPTGEKQVERAAKEKLVTSLNGIMKDAGIVVVAHYAGLNVARMTALRAAMKEAGASVKVAKNRLVKLALRGTELEHIADLFEGPTCIAYSSDPVSAPKVMVEFARKNENLVILGGGMGSTRLGEDGIKALAELPSLDELRARLVGMITTPASRIAQVVNAPAGQLARVLMAYAEKDKAA